MTNTTIRMALFYSMPGILLPSKLPTNAVTVKQRVTTIWAQSSIQNTRKYLDSLLITCSFSFRCTPLSTRNGGQTPPRNGCISRSGLSSSACISDTPHSTLFTETDCTEILHTIGMEGSAPMRWGGGIIPLRFRTSSLAGELYRGP